MKKFKYFFILLVLIFTFASCDANTTTYNHDISSNTSIYNNDISSNTSEYIIDYNDAKSFESALNDGAKVKDKIVRFDVIEYKPKSAMGINCWSGEHLNFISENEIDVKKGDIVIGRITKEPSKSLGSWKISYEVLEIESKQTETNFNTNSETNAEDSKTETKKITVTMSEDEFKKLTTADAEQELREMGFTIFKYDTLNAGNNNDLDGKIGAIEIKSWEFGKGDFSKGDTYDKDAIVVLWSYEYTEPAKPNSIFYSTNDYETAKKGNTGIFSYIDKSNSYDIYWIINFDEGYVYYFTDGNGEDFCDRLTIDSGDLNTNITVTYHDNGTQWSYKLHFKYKNHPETLIMVDQNGFEWKYSTTDLDDALSIRNTKTIKDY